MTLQRPKIWDTSYNPEEYRLPCNKCIGCKLANSKGWALRCQLELQDHDAAAWSTLTYDEKYKPPSLDHRHIQLFLKRLRKKMGSDRVIRYFLSGEYGEQTNRPHYHAILFGIPHTELATIENAWGQGHVRTTLVTPHNIAYTAGYTYGKAQAGTELSEERVDPETGEVYTYQPSYIEMSTRPGIGAKAKRWIQSWRTYAVQNGTKQPVPRYLHEAWKAQATQPEIEKLLAEKMERALRRDTTPEALDQAEREAKARHRISRDTRRY